MSRRAFVRLAQTTFGSLANPHFRWLWLGSLASSGTFQMGTVAQGWLVQDLTGSAFALGWVGSGWSISTLILSLYGGVISDRVERRRLLIYVRAGMLLNALLIAGLIASDVIQLWHLAASSLLTGILFAFMMPADQSLLAALVDRDTLLNAISLRAIGMGLMGIVSASVAGAVIEALGVEGVYVCMAALYGMALFALTRLPESRGQNATEASVWQDLKEGLGYIRHHKAIKVLLALCLARVLLGMPYRNLMPKFASEDLGLDASGLGMLLAAPGFGSTIAALALASLGNYRGKGRLLFVGGLAMGASLILFVLTPAIPIILLFLACVGATGNVCMVMNQTLLQEQSDDAHRGRVQSIYMMMWGLTPLGTMPAGAIADRVGVQPVIMAQGALFALVFVWLWVRRPVIRKLA